MASFLLEIVGSLIVTVLGFLGLMKIVFSMKARKKIWVKFGKASKKLKLDRKEGTAAGYGMPDLYGEMDDRKVYVHPVRGKKEAPPKTIYAVETKVRIDENLIISSPETSELDDKLPELESSNLKKYDLVVSSESQENQKILNEIIPGKVARKIDRVVKKNSDDFRAMIFESGLVMLSTYTIEDSTEKMKSNLRDMISIVRSVEENTDKLDENLKNERLEKIAEKSQTAYLELGVMSILAALGVYLAYTSILDLSFFFINSGIVIILIAGARIVSIVNTRGWLTGK